MSDVRATKERIEKLRTRSRALRDNGIGLAIVPMVALWPLLSGLGSLPQSVAPSRIEGPVVAPVELAGLLRQGLPTPADHQPEAQILGPAEREALKANARNRFHSVGGDPPSNEVEILAWKDADEYPWRLVSNAPSGLFLGGEKERTALRESTAKACRLDRPSEAQNCIATLDYLLEHRWILLPPERLTPLTRDQLHFLRAQEAFMTDRPENMSLELASITGAWRNPTPEQRQRLQVMISTSERYGMTGLDAARKLVAGGTSASALPGGLPDHAMIKLALLIVAGILECLGILAILISVRRRAVAKTIDVQFNALVTRNPDQFPQDARSLDSRALHRSVGAATRQGRPSFGRSRTPRDDLTRA